MDDKMFYVLMAIFFGTVIWYFFLRRSVNRSGESEYSYRCPICCVTYESPGSCPTCNSDLQFYHLVYDENAIHTMDNILRVIDKHVHKELQNEAIKKGTEVITSLDVENAVLRLFHEDPRTFLQWKE